MRVAFHAPLKPPDHAVPSGDRAMARAFLGLLGDLGHTVGPVGRFRTYDRHGDARRQRRIAALGGALAARLQHRVEAGRLPRPELWLTYHCYHKAPDHLGPAVARGLGLPYVVAEGSVSPRQADGPWAVGHAASLAALAAADLVLAMTERDRSGLVAAGLEPDRIRLFPPFLDTAPFRAADLGRAQHRAALAERLHLEPDAPWLLAVGMMRADVKQRSFEMLAHALAGLGNRPWRLVVVGDGPARPGIEAALLAAAGERVRLLGTLPGEALPPIYAACDLLVWPAIGEAYGMVLLEAQAAGTPVVAGAEGGVPEIVDDGRSGVLVAPIEAERLAATVAALLDDPERRAALGRGAAERVLTRHDRPVAARRLEVALHDATLRRTARRGRSE